MPIRHAQTLRQRPTVSPQLVLANELLQFSTVELEQAIAHELAENPALELSAVERCPHCGSDMPDGYCRSCGASKGQDEQDWDVPARTESYDGYESFELGADAGWEDPVARLASRMTLTDYLLQQARLSMPPDDVPIAVHLIESLDDRGFLRCDLAEVASMIGVERGGVESVLSIVQSLEPVGIATRDARECLLVQIQHLCDEGVEQPVAQLLIEEHWDILGTHALSSVAEAAGISRDEVSEALRFIRQNLNPYPAHVFLDSRHDPGQDVVACPEPDVIIRESRTAKGEYEIELPRARRYRVQVSPAYRQAMDALDASTDSSGPGRYEQWQQFYSRARLFVNSIEQRWRTLHELMVCLIDCQRDFLSQGEVELKPLTRAQVAEMIGVHESTVSRAVAGKYVQLPTREVVPLEKFFDSAAPVKHVIQDLVDQEEKTLSDSAIAEILSERGYEIARRTVAKYRNALGILPYSLRRRRKDLSSQ